MYRRGAWLRKGLVVKIMSPELKAEGLYKKKGNVVRLINKQVSSNTCFCVARVFALQGVFVCQHESCSSLFGPPHKRTTLLQCRGFRSMNPVIRWWQVAEVELTDGSAAVQIHDSQLETVIPQPGGTVVRAWHGSCDIQWARHNGTSD